MSEIKVTRWCWYWLLLVTLVVMAFSLSLLLAPVGMRQFFSWIMYASPTVIGGFTAQSVAYITLMHGVLGAVMLGWATLMLWVICGPFRRAESGAWGMLSVSLLVWFVPDTAFSLWTGFWQNALFNLLFAICYAIPLLCTYPQFRLRDATANSHLGG